ncbi:methionyl-tRNA formyltransferase [Halobium salinum]|uniref:Methionyl-tRNA formyltransferase n=1 Tax=Halobium salinum TaxID=1364940 RepID=A0ABD5P9Z3_9EURY|nr:methionyl-tRNA formyltransferase [Halobium salinum]
MRVVFVTRNDLGLACLEELVDLGADVRAVFTRPERANISDQTDLSSFAERHGVGYHETEELNTEEECARLASYDPELLFVVGWSRLVDREVIETASVATLGMHPAPLPRGRGRAPIAWNLIKGLDETALSFFHLVEEADAGDLVGQHRIPIFPTDDAASLYAKVVDAGRALVREHFPRFESGEVPRTPQNDDEATWWPKRSPQHGLVDWNQSPGKIHDWIRGQSRPYPGAFSHLPALNHDADGAGTLVTFWSTSPPSGERAFGHPGEIAYRDGGRLGVYCFEGALELTELQVGNDEPIPAGELVERYDVGLGVRFVNARDQIN